MDSHENARTIPRGRMLMVERLRSGWTEAEVAAAAGVCPATARKWRDRFAAEGEAGRFIRTSLREWAYASPFLDSGVR